ncbi:MAG: hypothetical protein AB7S70_17170 [Hyphomicrobium sp.]|uniref:hypothetical protein n=1 Tax=Hyphomicrobium sp. TaxID=82 RepID=UPI003D0F209D
MCELSVIFTFVMAHIVTWAVLGASWRAAGRAPFVVFVPAVALVLLNAVITDSYTALGWQLITLVSWEIGYFFLYVCLRIAIPAGPPSQALPRK